MIFAFGPVYCHVEFTTTHYIQYVGSSYIMYQVKLTWQYVFLCSLVFGLKEKSIVIVWGRGYICLCHPHCNVLYICLCHPHCLDSGERFESFATATVVCSWVFLATVMWSAPAYTFWQEFSVVRPSDRRRALHISSDRSEASALAPAENDVGDMMLDLSHTWTGCLTWQQVHDHAWQQSRPAWGSASPVGRRLPPPVIRPVCGSEQGLDPLFFFISPYRPNSLLVSLYDYYYCSTYLLLCAARTGVVQYSRQFAERINERFCSAWLFVCLEVDDQLISSYLSIIERSFFLYVPVDDTLLVMICGRSITWSVRTAPAQRTGEERGWRAACISSRWEGGSSPAA